MIQSNQKVMYSFDNELVVKNLSWKSDKISVEFHEFVKVTSNQQITANITKLKETLDSVTSLAKMDFKPDFLGLGISRRIWNDFTGMFSLVVTILSILCFIFVCSYSRIKKNNRLVRIVMQTLKQEKRERRAIRYNNSTALLESPEDGHRRTPEMRRAQHHSKTASLKTEDDHITLAVAATKDPQFNEVRTITDAYGSL